MYNADYPYFDDCGDDYVVVRVNDGELYTVTKDDVNNYSVNMGSGMSCLGDICGDHRCITAIYEAVAQYFNDIAQGGQHEST